VLLSSTANPLWCKNPWLGPLFSASAIATGAEAIGLALDATTKNSPSHAALRKIDTVAHAVEGACMRGFMRHAGEAAKPLLTGKQAKQHKFSIGAILAAELLKLLPARGPLGKVFRVLSNVLGLAGGFSLRWSIVHGGREAADDPHLSRLVGDPKYQQGRSAGKTLSTGRGTEAARVVGSTTARAVASGRGTAAALQPDRGAHGSAIVPR
jgi:hypothetical protein